MMKNYQMWIVYGLLGLFALAVFYYFYMQNKIADAKPAWEKALTAEAGANFDYFAKTATSTTDTGPYYLNGADLSTIKDFCGKWAPPNTTKTVADLSDAEFLQAIKGTLPNYPNAGLKDYWVNGWKKYWLWQWDLGNVQKDPNFLKIYVHGNGSATATAPNA